ncbi:CoA-transferase [Methanolapillus ohkumae]|uniref:Acetate CoA-transferase YdiF n=1 Tax=Methanolapillus ohkumae TaxID=3028298 RepID=A0AA96VFZ9_9EURY|nr:Acetate CoA-transferase YdiF [Methanosarcinaceae archaeon Am2]
MFDKIRIMKGDDSLFKFMSADEAVGLIQDGNVIGVNAFLSISNPTELHLALTRRFQKTKSPRNLTVFCSAGFGDWKENSPIEGYIQDGAVSCAILGHLGSMPTAAKRIGMEEIEGYNLPLGTMSHMIRAAAGGKEFYATRIGLNLFTDPDVGGYQLNRISKTDWVSKTKIGGKPYLLYKTPEIDIAFIKGTSSDALGNISFEKECATVDALALAQAVHRRGGKVIVQVERVISNHLRPRNVIVPGILVDAIVVCSNQSQLVSVHGYEPTYSGDTYIPPQELSDWAKAKEKNASNLNDPERLLVASRAFLELSAGQVANIGIGIPEAVAVVAAKEGLLKDITLTVESGAIGGLPASGISFGAASGADTIYDMSQQFDFYDGGGLDICFIGALEIDALGNVNGHMSAGRMTGIGGFANITQSTPVVVFCATFSAGGLLIKIENKDGNGHEKLKIVTEGKYPKFVQNVRSVSFSAKNAQESGQKVLYITERCVFQLTGAGLMLTEIVDGIDLKRDILDRLPFDVLISPDLKTIPAKLVGDKEEFK